MRLLSRMLQRHIPPMNDLVMKGYAVHALRHLEDYMDAQIASICVGMPACVKYVGWERCTEDEAYAEMTRVRSSRRYYNLARSSIYLVKYFFEYTDPTGTVHRITKHIFLPYVTKGGIMFIGGTEMHLVPVLSDKVFTANGSSIFVRLVQDRNNFFRMYHTVRLNGKNETRYVAHAEIYRTPDRKAGTGSREITTRAKTVLPHYLFARYGFTGAFKRYLNIEPIVGDEKTITKDLYDPSEWVICESTRIQPKKSNLDKFYQPSNIRLAIPKGAWSHEVECLVVGFFYVVDHFPHRFKASLDVLNDTALWMILIGHIRFSGDYAENRLYASIKEHFETIEPYLDQAVKDKLAENNIHLENYFDLLYYIQATFNKFILMNEQNGLSIYGKNLELYQYVVYDILYWFTMAKFKLNKQSARSQLSLKDVEEIIRRIIRPGSIFQLSQGNKIVCEVVGSSSDHMYPKITSIVAQQENRAGGNRADKKRVVPGPEHHIDLSMVTAGSVLNLPKANPTPVVRVNPWITIDPNTGTVLPDPKFQSMIEKNRPLFKL